MLQHKATELPGAWRFRLGDADWTPVTVPHSWNALDAVHPGPAHYRRGVGIYATELATPADGRTFLRFGAASQKAIVTWNGTEISRHLGGYLPFTV